MGEYYFLFYDKINSSDYFLINRLGKSISDQSIRNIVKSFASKAGVKKHITPHIFRHSFATLLLERDVDIKYIQSMLGHSSIMTTQIYTHVNREKQIEILKTKHPRRNVSMF
jgi:integrase/recombinase XerD